MEMAKQGGPFQIIDQDGSRSGIITDVVFEIFKNSPHQLKIHTWPYLRMKQNMKSGKYPGWLRYGAKAWGPMNDNLSDKPVIKVKNVLLVRKENPFKFSNIQDLFDNRIILIVGFSYRELKPYIQSKKIGEIRVKSFEKAYRAMDLDRGVGVPDMQVRMLYNLKTQGRDIQRYNIFDFSSVIKNYGIHLNMDPAISKDIQAFINTRLNTLLNSGFVDKTIKKYIE